MKKLVALVAALVMLLSFAMAEETVQNIVFTDMVPEDQLEQQGIYAPVVEGFPAKIWVLNGAFLPVAASEIPAEVFTGMEVGVFKFADDESLLVILSAIANDGGSFDDLVAALKADPDTFIEPEEAIINGFRSVSYSCNEADGAVLRYATYEVSDSVWLNIMFKASDNEMYTQACGLLAASVAPAD